MTEAAKKEYALIRCVDSRYCVGNHVEKLPRGYSFTCPGASLWFVDSPAWREEFFKQVNVLKSVGKNIVGITIADHFCKDGHHGCAAYGQDDSLERHQTNLRQTANLIRQETGFENMEIELLLHDIDNHAIYTISETTEAPSTSEQVAAA